MAKINPTFDDLDIRQRTAIGSMQYLHVALVKNSPKDFYRLVNNLGDVRDETTEIICNTTRVRVRIQIEVSNIIAEGKSNE